MPRTLTRDEPAAVGLTPDGLAKLDAQVQTWVDNRTLAGASILVARHGKIVHERLIGAKDIATGEPLAPDTIFRIFSMTKPVTAVAMMVLYDRGLWRPEDAIAKYLPEFEGVRVFDGLAADGSAKTVAADRAPTLLDLMTHTAGFQYGFDPSNALDQLYRDADVWASANLAEFSRRLAALPLGYQPGSKWVYSLAMDLQGAIIERLSGQPLAAFMRETIFAPLGMIDTGFALPPGAEPRLAKLYRSSESRGLVELAKPPQMADFTRNADLPSGGGGLVSTIADYARFAQMLLDRGAHPGGRIISEAAAALMMSNHVAEPILAAYNGVGAQKLRPGFGYGFNGAVYYDPAKAQMPVGAGTYQWDGAAGTWFWVDPVNDLLFVGMIQLMSLSAPPFQVITQKLIAEAMG
jgi:CubicO group peptidase (beta-lactamase class C family)